MRKLAPLLLITFLISLAGNVLADRYRCETGDGVVFYSTPKKILAGQSLEDGANCARVSDKAAIAEHRKTLESISRKLRVVYKAGIACGFSLKLRGPNHHKSRDHCAGVYGYLNQVNDNGLPSWLGPALRPVVSDRIYIKQGDRILTDVNRKINELTALFEEIKPYRAALPAH